MTTDQVRRFLDREPFRPFVLYLTDGRAIRVDHPRLMALSSGGRTAAIFVEPEAAEVVDLLLVTSLKEMSDRDDTGNGRRGT